MENELQNKIAELEIKINEIHKIVKSAKRIYIWSVVISLLLFIVPLIILIFVLPSMLETITSGYSGLL